MAQFDGSCLRVATESHIAEILAGHPNGLHAKQISEKTGIESGKLARIMRLLATKHCFIEGN